jgi:ankyrin repeat protein
MNIKLYMRKAFQTAVFACFCGLAVADSFVEFFRAVDLDRAEVVQQLLQRGFPVNAINEYGQTGFTLALRGPSPKAAEVLFAHPAFDVHQTTAAGETPLLIAALQGDEVWTRRLLDRGARHESPSGFTALHYAASSANPGVLRLVLRRDPPLDAQAPNGNTPLHLAAAYGDARNVDLLLLTGADPRIANRAGARPADLARAQGRERLALLLEQAAQQRR